MLNWTVLAIALTIPSFKNFGWHPTLVSAFRVALTLDLGVSAALVIIG